MQKSELVVECTYCGFRWPPTDLSEWASFQSRFDLGPMPDDSKCPKCEDKNVVTKKVYKIDQYSQD